MVAGHTDTVIAVRVTAFIGMTQRYCRESGQCYQTSRRDKRMLRTVEHFCLREEVTGFHYLSRSKLRESAKSEFHVGHQEQLLNDLMHFRPNERARLARHMLYGVRALDEPSIWRATGYTKMVFGRGNIRQSGEPH